MPCVRCKSRKATHTTNIERDRRHTCDWDAVTMYDYEAGYRVSSGADVHAGDRHGVQISI